MSIILIHQVHLKFDVLCCGHEETTVQLFETILFQVKKTSSLLYVNMSVCGTRFISVCVCVTTDRLFTIAVILNTINKEIRRKDLLSSCLCMIFSVETSASGRAVMLTCIYPVNRGKDLCCRRFSPDCSLRAVFIVLIRFRITEFAWECSY